MVVKMTLSRSYPVPFISALSTLNSNHISNVKLDLLTSFIFSLLEDNVRQTQSTSVALVWLSIISLFNLRLWMYSFLGYSSICDNHDYGLIYLGTFSEAIFM